MCKTILMRLDGHMRSFVAASCIAAGFAFATSSCEEAQESESLSTSPPPAVVLTAVERQDVTPSKEFVGRVEAIDKVDLRARVTGFIEQRLFEEGSEVAAGDLMFVIEKAPYQAAVSRARADVAKAEASLAQAEATRQRVQRAAKSGAVSKQQLDETIASEKVASAELLKAQAVLEKAQLDLSYTDIYTPLTGRVGREAFAVGNLVGPENGALATVASQDPVFVVFSVSQRMLLDYQKRQLETNGAPGEGHVTLKLADGTIYEHLGKIDFADIEVSQSTDTLDIISVFSNPDAMLTDGQFVTVFVEEKESRNSVVIPRSAMQIDQAGRYVLVVDSENLVERRRISTGEDFGVRVVVTEGLNEGENIIVEGIQRARPGQKVNPIDTVAENPQKM